MRNHESAMLAYVRLASMSHEKQQAVGRDRFLVLAGFEACNSGWLDVAELCRVLVLRSNPRHLLGNCDSFPDAIRSKDNQLFFASLARFCPMEQAEHLLRQHDAWPDGNESDSTGEMAMSELETIHIE